MKGAASIANGHMNPMGRGGISRPATRKPKSGMRSPQAKQRLGLWQATMSETNGTHRMLPQSPEAEKGILCSFLLAPSEVGNLCASRRIVSEHFHIPAHAIILGELFEAHEQCEP